MRHCFATWTAALAALGLAAAPLAAQPNPGSALDGLARLRDDATMRASSSDPNWKDGNADARPIPPGQTLTVADLKGPGEITHIWVTIAANERSYSRLLVVRMYWDGEAEPSVECPIGDFFGIGHGLDVPFDSLPIRVTSNGRGRNCYWPMPFRKSARITVTNEGKQPVGAFYYYVDWRKVKRLDRNVAYFHAQYRQEHPAVMGRNYLIADIAGRGHYVGTLLSCRQHIASWWGEGDDFFFIDGEQEPSLRGTGTEDYFCDGWGFVKQAGIYYGAPLMEGMEVGNRTTVYRWHIPDPVTFRKSLRLEIEHKGVTFHPDGRLKSGFEERPDDLSSVAFWYQTEPHKPYPPLPPAQARLYYDFSGLQEGEARIPAASATEGVIEPQDIAGASGGKHLWWRPSREGETLRVPVEVKEAGLYEVLVLLTSSWDYGTVHLRLGDANLGGPIDLYAATVTPVERVFAPVRLPAGTIDLEVRNVGKSGASKGHLFGLDGILLVKRG